MKSFLKCSHQVRTVPVNGEMVQKKYMDVAGINYVLSFMREIMLNKLSCNYNGSDSDYV